MIGLMATLVVTAAGVAGFGWRVLRQETDKLRGDTESLRRESRMAHERIGGEIAKVRDDLRGKLAQARDELLGEIAQLRDGQSALREGMGEIRGELRVSTILCSPFGRTSGRTCWRARTELPRPYRLSSACRHMCRHTHALKHPLATGKL